MPYLIKQVTLVLYAGALLLILSLPSACVDKSADKLYKHFSFREGKRCLVELSDKYLLVKIDHAENLKIRAIHFEFKNQLENDIQVEWICALREDLSVVRCSTDTDIFSTQRLFEDNGVYTVKFFFKNSIAVNRNTHVDISIDLDDGKHIIPIVLHER